MSTDICEVTKVINPFDPSDMAIVKEKETFYGGTGSDTKYYERTIEYLWASFDKCIGSDEETYALVPKVAGGIEEKVVDDHYQEVPAETEWKKVETKKIRYRDYLSALNLVDIDETVTALCVYWTQKEKDDSTSYQQCRPIMEQMEILGAAIAEENDDDGYGWQSGLV
jgi:hypothetical protein